MRNTTSGPIGHVSPTQYRTMLPTLEAAGYTSTYIHPSRVVLLRTATGTVPVTHADDLAWVLSATQPARN